MERAPLTCPTCNKQKRATIFANSKRLSVFAKTARDYLQKQGSQQKAGLLTASIKQPRVSVHLSEHNCTTVREYAPHTRAHRRKTTLPHRAKGRQTMAKNNDNKRTRNWSLVTYLDKETLCQRLCSIDNIRYYAFIEHDKDVQEDGTPKDRHIHLALVLNSARTLQQIAPRFTDITSNAGNCFGQPTRSNRAIIDYFTHKNEPEKHQYSESEIISNNIDYFKNDETDEDNTYMIIEDLLNGKSLRELAKTYGRALLYHYRDFRDFVKDCKDEERR